RARRNAAIPHRLAGPRPRAPGRVPGTVRRPARLRDHAAAPGPGPLRLPARRQRRRTALRPGAAVNATTPAKRGSHGAGSGAVTRTVTAGGAGTRWRA